MFEREVHIVAQIGHLPVEAGRIGDDSKRIVVNVELAADIFDDNALARGVVDDGVDGRREAPLLEHRRGDKDRADIGLDLVDAGEIVENPRAQLPWRDRLCGVRRRVSHVSGHGGEVEQAGREPGLVDAVDEDRQADAVRPDARVFRLPLEAVLAVRRRADALEAAWRDEDVGLKVDGEFERPRMDDRPVGGGEADAGAGVGGAREKKRAGCDHRGELVGESAGGHRVAPGNWIPIASGWVAMRTAHLIGRPAGVNLTYLGRLTADRRNLRLGRVSPQGRC